MIIKIEINMCELTEKRKKKTNEKRLLQPQSSPPLPRVTRKNMCMFGYRNLESAFRYTFNRIVIELKRSQILQEVKTCIANTFQVIITQIELMQ